MYFNKSRPLGFELETFGSDTMLSYYAPTSCTQKLRLVGKGGKFIYTSTLSERNPEGMCHRQIVRACEKLVAAGSGHWSS
jgi:hypothetical protein